MRKTSRQHSLRRVRLNRPLPSKGGADGVLPQGVGAAQPAGAGSRWLGGVLRPRHKRFLVPRKGSLISGSMYPREDGEGVGPEAGVLSLSSHAAIHRRPPPPPEKPAQHVYIVKTDMTTRGFAARIADVAVLLFTNHRAQEHRG